jgi:hypothetical protein
MKTPAGCQSLFAFEQAVVDAARASAHAKLQANLAAKAQRAILKRQAELDKANRRFKRDEKRKGKTPNEYAQCGICWYCRSPHNVALGNNPYFNPECECLVVLFLNTKKRIKGHQLVTIGTMDTMLCHSREIFRAAIVSSAACIAIMHNHPSGEPTPSEADIKVTRDLIRAGQLLKIEVIDHVIVGNGNPGFSSLRALGYFWQ